MWLSSLRHIAKEGRLVGVGCCTATRVSDIPDRFEFKRYYAEGPEWINKGDSAIVNPDGKVIAGPLNAEEGILYADIDTRQFRGPKWKLDVAGHYARPDVFRLTVQRGAQPMIVVAETVPDETHNTVEEL